jgi:pimeloyl-ACP methyl ester carboxylesterase
LTSANELRPLAFREGGSGDRVAVFVHGMYQSSIFWDPTLADLPPGVRGIAMDLPGFGDSHKLPGPYTIQGHAEAVDAFVRARGLSDVVLVGNSMGSIVCQQLAINRPDWLARLVVVSAGPNVPDPVGALAAAEAEATMPWDRPAAEECVRHFFVRQPVDPEPYIEVALQARREARLEAPVVGADGPAAGSRTDRRADAHRPGRVRHRPHPSRRRRDGAPDPERAIARRSWRGQHTDARECKEISRYSPQFLDLVSVEAIAGLSSA